MKKYLICAITLLLNISSYASDIRGLNQNQIDDLDICLSKKGLAYDQVNGWENQISNRSSYDQKRPLFHNFNQFGDQRYDLQGPHMDNAIFVSGLFNIEGQHSFKNSIISNMTFVGDFSKLDFEGACLVNVRFYKASLYELSKIKRNSSYFKNIHSN